MQIKCIKCAAQPSRPQLQPAAVQPPDIASLTADPVEAGSDLASAGDPASAGDLDFLDMPDLPNQPVRNFATSAGL